LNCEIDMKGDARVDSLIGAKTRIEGKVFFVGGLRLEGSICGNVRARPEEPGTLIVSKQGRIDGEVAGPHLVVNGIINGQVTGFETLVVNGTINGQVTGFETLELRSSARVSGDVYYKLMAVRQGAIVEGRLAKCAAGDPKQAAELEPAFSG
jgi:cytoskeletal protein CcmA (bactofilin family)